MSTEQIMKIIVADPYANVTFSGGDPMYQCDGFAELARAIHNQTNKDIWCYTGYTYETDLLSQSRARCEVTDEMLSYIDVLVDGEFIEEQYDISLKFRGSKNQRIINLH